MSSVFEWSSKSRDFTIWKPDTYTVWFTDESSIQVFSIQMITVKWKKIMRNAKTKLQDSLIISN